MDDNNQSKIRMLDRGRFIRKHNGGLVYHDSRHKIHHTKLFGGFIGELVQELQLDGSFRDQLRSRENRAVMEDESVLKLSYRGEQSRFVAHGAFRFTHA